MAQDYRIFPLSSYEFNHGETQFYVSMSDYYRVSEHPDSLPIPDTLIGPQETAYAEYSELKGKYRKMFLNGMELQEEDQLFLYNYSLSKLHKFTIKDLNVVAVLSPYVSWDYEALGPYDYMIGFELDPTIIKAMGLEEYHCLITVGRQNPFTKGKVEAITWKPISNDAFPNFLKSDSNQIWSKSEHLKTFCFATKGMTYYLRDIPGLRRLVVIDEKSQEKLLDRLLQEGESASAAPLKLSTDKDQGQGYQWTGRLFKYKAPVIFGMQYHSFGCPSIYLIGSKEPPLYIACDNRH